MNDITRHDETVTCARVRELLSDLLDVRRGEAPATEATPLADAVLLEAVEGHIAECGGCREELRGLQEVGAAFADFSVNEAPSQHFAEYGRIVRERMGQPVPAVKPVAAESRPRVLRLRTAFAFSASALAAACVLVVVSKLMPVANLTKGKVELAKAPEIVVPAAAAAPRLASVPDLVVPRTGSVPLTLLDTTGSQPRKLRLEHDPSAPDWLKKIKETEARSGYLVFGEAGDSALLGLYLRTTRDQGTAADRPGLMVYQVESGSTAQEMQLRKDDFIVALNNIAVKTGGPEDAANVLRAIAHAGSGTPVKLQVVRPVGSEMLFLEKTGVLGETRATRLAR